VTAMPIRSAFAVPLLASLTAGIAECQPAATFLNLMDQFSRTFTGAKANIRTTTHPRGIPEDDVETGVFLVKRAGGKTQFRIDFAPPNVYTVAVHDQLAEIYRPKLNETQVYDLSAYKDLAQYFLLGFGMPVRELASSYEIRDLKHETVDGQAATHLELIPKSPAVAKQLKSIEIWISDANQCPVRQTFHFPDGGFRTAQFSALEVNPKFPGGAFDLPKGAKRVRAN